MNKETENYKCFNCGKDEKEVPLVQLIYSGTPSWICPQCLPVLIHHIDQLTEKLKEIPGK
jgi:DNA-directed RNA polymerase subunit RPC12/RpoP